MKEDKGLEETIMKEEIDIICPICEHYVKCVGVYESENRYLFLCSNDSEICNFSKNVLFEDDINAETV